MKPKHLIRPTSWEERRVLIEDRVWHVPQRLDDYTTYIFPGWEHRDLFDNARPVVIEYCSGNGAWIVDKACSDPLRNWVGVEKRFERVRKIWSKLKNQAISNLLVLAGEAFTATKFYFPSASVDEIFINFPDPWPKKRHAKNRLIQPAFIEELGRILKPTASVNIVTDDPAYSAVIIDDFAKNPRFSSFYPSPFFATDVADYGSSYFDQLWRQKGRTIRYHRFMKSQ